MIATEYCNNVFDGTHDTPKPCSTGTHKLLTSKNILNGELDKTDAYYISDEDYKEINKRSKVHQWDVLFSMIGTVGNVCLVTDPNVDYAIKNMGDFSCLDENKARWLYYYLQSPYAKKLIQNYLNGAIQKFLPLGWLRDLDIPECTNNSMRIVSVLDAIDSKINLNKSICDDLETITKEIFEYWFVQFDFPDKDGKPYKSNGGKMVRDEKLNRDIPAGWKCKPLGEIIEIGTERIQLKDVKGKVYVPIEVIPRKKMSFYETAEVEKAATGLCPFTARSILLSNRRVYFHKVCISPYDGVTRDTVIIINPINSDNLGFVFQQVYSDHFIKYATLNSYGSEQPVLSPISVQNYLIAYPSDGLDERYSKRINPLINKILSIQKENRELTALKGFLLPMLMNGQIKFAGE